jgi:hypothetical protein
MNWLTGFLGCSQFVRSQQICRSDVKRVEGAETVPASLLVCDGLHSLPIAAPLNAGIGKEVFVKLQFDASLGIARLGNCFESDERAGKPGAGGIPEIFDADYAALRPVCPSGVDQEPAIGKRARHRLSVSVFDTATPLGFLLFQLLIIEKRNSALFNSAASLKQFLA